MESKIQNQALLSNSNMWPGNFIFNYFGDPALNLRATGYEITQATTLINYVPEIQYDLTISTEVHVRSGATLSFMDNVRVNFEDAGKLIIDNGATLCLGHNSFFYGKEAANSVEVQGNLTCSYYTGPNITFEGLATSAGCAGFIFNNPSLNVNITKLTMSKCAIFGTKLNSFTLSSASNDRSTISNSPLFFQDGTISILNSDFSNSNTSFQNLDAGLSTVTIKSCNFTGNNQDAWIYLSEYPIFDIEDNSISFQRFDAISLFNSGLLSGQSHLIKHNTINFTGSTYQNNNGIKVYHSNVDVEKNTISNASYGISCLNSSNIKLAGDCNATSASGTQQFINNRENQVFASLGSFPYYVKYNYFDNSINSNPMIYLKTSIMPSTPVYNIKCNNWGSSFIPSQDLYPLAYYYYSPTWSFNGCTCVGDSPQVKFESSKELAASQEYTESEAKLKEIIQESPESIYAQASVNELLSLAITQNTGLSSLKDYLSLVSSTSNIEDLKKLADYSSLWCDIKIENYNDVITSLEEKLSTASTLEDSVFSLIDLSYIYFLVNQDSLKSLPASILPGIVCKDHKEFIQKKAGWIDLLYQNEQSQDKEDLKSSNYIIDVVPNPAIDFAQLEVFTTKKTSIVGQISIVDETGKAVQNLPNLVLFDGGQFPLNINILSNGLYFVLLRVDNQIVAKCKLIVRNN